MYGGAWKGPLEKVPVLRRGELLVEFEPRVRCFCGVVPSRFDRFVSEAINRRAASRVGLLAAEEETDWSAIERVEVLLQISA
jgi:hypothetical protein